MFVIHVRIVIFQTTPPTNAGATERDSYVLVLEILASCLSKVLFLCTTVISCTVLYMSASCDFTDNHAIYLLYS